MIQSFAFQRPFGTIAEMAERAESEKNTINILKFKSKSIYIHKDKSLAIVVKQ